MEYKDFQGKDVSGLGMGCMRLPVIDGDYTRIDKEQVERMVAHAMEHGINYFDTAWGYHNGNSEIVMGEVLSKYPRCSFLLADKFPGYDASNFPKLEEIFFKQLEKCQTPYFDFYLLHNVCESNIDFYLDPKWGVLDFMLLQKRAGRIRHLGFSVHGSQETFQRFLEVYGQYMEFCQIQLNYLDWDFQDAKSKVKLLNMLHIPIAVMEPLRGGRLVDLEPQHMERLRRFRPDVPAVEWALRWCDGTPGVFVVLSGMSNLEQLEQNVEIFERDERLIMKERMILEEIGHEMTGRTSIPCTKCSYCTSYCPMELDIPWFIELYNEHVFTDDGFIAPMAMDAVEEGHKPKDCIACRSCEAVCPQKIEISKVMADFAERLGE
ncbi:MAG: aldo/keto reductase [Coriobacteriales bacterium]|nr:aldo/keto reductase [Coriobacteriales bacterium]MBQ6586560.1 aldo/keto reductase [Coriobacteriales bacterium]